jgi:hypothetical protein
MNFAAFIAPRWERSHALFVSNFFNIELWKKKKKKKNEKIPQPKKKCGEDNHKNNESPFTRLELFRDGE